MTSLSNHHQYAILEDTTSSDSQTVDAAIVPEAVKQDWRTYLKHLLRSIKQRKGLQNIHTREVLSNGEHPSMVLSVPSRTRRWDYFTSSQERTS